MAVETYFQLLQRHRENPSDDSTFAALNALEKAIAETMPDSYVEVYSGTMVNITRPTADMITLEDIAHALSRIPRFNGHSHIPYTVARHTILVVDILKSWGANPELLLMAWLHDAPEAYLGDIPTPLKRLFQPMFNILEVRFLTAIYDALIPNLEFGEPDDYGWLKHADGLALLVERAVLKYPGKPTSHDWQFPESLYEEAKKLEHLCPRHAFTPEQDRVEFLRGLDSAIKAVLSQPK
jgi:hypothetical protein